MTLVRLLLLSEATVCLAGARVALAVLPYPKFELLLQDEAGAGDARTAEAKSVGSAVRRIAGIVPWRSDCLIQASAAKWMLRRRGIPARLHVGVTSGDGSFEAHAWLVHETIVLTGKSGQNRFRTIRIY